MRKHSIDLGKLVSAPKSNAIFPTDDGIITSQPSNKNKSETVYPDCPKGLEALSDTEHLFIKQSGLPVEMFKSLETHYEVLNSSGEKIFMAEETTDTSTRAWCRGTKPFDVSVFIRSGLYRKEVMKMDGEPRSCGCGGDITLRLTKYSLGTIEQGTECSVAHYSIKDTLEQEILQIIGPPGPFNISCFGLGKQLTGGEEFEVFVPESQTSVGKIAKYWGGKEKEILMKSDIWGVRFPLDMKVTHKALLLAACFLLNFQHQDNLDE